MNFQIPLLKKIERREIIEENKSRDKLFDNYFINTINDRSKGEIISATKYCVFNDCPLKYNLIYNLKYDAISKDYNQWLQNYIHGDEYEFNQNEQRRITYEESNSQSFMHSNIKGRIIHKILQTQNPKESIKNTAYRT